eukprot:GDKI01017158.1.p1 GENE.GDKI01017158.1~~GDKI01017158.1.p1  ORF type:complete len:433 (-),score=119.96 GDKI01017158.1:462-1760(-)
MDEMGTAVAATSLAAASILTQSRRLKTFVHVLFDYGKFFVAVWSFIAAFFSTIEASGRVSIECPASLEGNSPVYQEGDELECWATNTTYARRRGPFGAYLPVFIIPLVFLSIYAMLLLRHAFLVKSYGTLQYVLQSESIRRTPLYKLFPSLFLLFTVGSFSYGAHVLVQQNMRNKLADHLLQFCFVVLGTLSVFPPTSEELHPNAKMRQVYLNMKPWDRSNAVLAKFKDAVIYYAARNDPYPLQSILLPGVDPDFALQTFHDTSISLDCRFATVRCKCEAARAAKRMQAAQLRGPSLYCIGMASKANDVSKAGAATSAAQLDVGVADPPTTSDAVHVELQHVQVAGEQLQTDSDVERTLRASSVHLETGHGGVDYHDDDEGGGDEPVPPLPPVVVRATRQDGAAKASCDTVEVVGDMQHGMVGDRLRDDTCV